VAHADALDSPATEDHGEPAAPAGVDTDGGGCGQDGLPSDGVSNVRVDPVVRWKRPASARGCDRNYRWTAYGDDVEGCGVSDRPLARRRVLGGAATTSGAALLGVTSTVLPSAAAAASVLESSGVPADSLVFHLDASLPGESPASIWADRSGNNNSGSTTGSGVTHVTATGGVPAHYSLDGSASAVIPVAFGATLFGSVATPPTGYTKMVWFRRDAVDATHNLVSSTATGAPHYLWFKEPTYRYVTAGHDGTAGAQQATLQVDPDVWTFGAATFSTTNGLRILTNTSDRTWADTDVSEDAEFPSYTAAPSDGMTFQIGGYADSATNRLEGDVATVVVHSRALSDTEVRAYYAATVDRFHP